ncbi:23S ribosomal RNA methyltransferase Erm [Streptomyces caelestis]|uniref:23S ribosomal RNA methyltransferase Erm n=1 Tax=Streptomyces caelestis TaxID=36816 RepID=UPI00380C4664
MTEWGPTHRKGPEQGKKSTGYGRSEAQRGLGFRTRGASAERGRTGGGPAAPVTADERRRVWGQNFFKSKAAVRRFTAQIGAVEGLPTVEIGPGSGMITKELAKSGEPLTVVEIDDQWARLLAEELPSHVTMVNEDFLSWGPETECFRMVGNLPFGASTEILRTCLGYGPDRFLEGVFLVQLEFARKRAGAWGGNLFNAQWSPWFTFHMGHEFPRHCFRPVPKTDTATLFVDPRRDPLLPWRERVAYQELVSAVFNTGQLTVGEAAQRVNVRKPADWLRRAEVFPETRVKDLDAEDWSALFATHQPGRPRTGAGGRPSAGRRQGGRRGMPPPGGGPRHQRRR